jgi:hypothetical protein
VIPRVDPAAANNHTLCKASERGHLWLVERLLLRARVHPAAFDNDAIRRASRRGHLFVVHRLLQDSRVNPAAADNDALSLTSREGHLPALSACCWTRVWTLQLATTQSFAMRARADTRVW